LGDAENRSKFSDESKMLYAQLSPSKAIIFFHDVDLAKMAEFFSSPYFMELTKGILASPPEMIIGSYLTGPPEEKQAVCGAIHGELTSSIYKLLKCDSPC
jgi:hypothetical protein